MRVRFPSPAPTRKRRSTGLTRSPSSPRRWTHAPAASTTRPKTPGHPGHPPAARRSPPSSPATHRATGRHENSPKCSTSTPAIWPPSSANGPCSAFSPAPAWAPTGSTRRHRHHPRQPDRTLTTRHWHAIGFAEPRPGTRSPGIGAYRGRWSRAGPRVRRSRRCRSAVCRPCAEQNGMGKDRLVHLLFVF